MNTGKIIIDPLYEMELNSKHHFDDYEILRVDDYEILRVPGGWIYTRFSENGTGGYNMSSCFVPFDNEFQ